MNLIHKGWIWLNPSLVVQYPRVHFLCALTFYLATSVNNDLYFRCISLQRFLNTESRSFFAEYRNLHIFWHLSENFAVISIDWSVVWLVHWLVIWLMCEWIHEFQSWSIVLFICWLIDGLMGWLIDWLVVRGIDRSFGWFLKQLDTFVAYSSSEEKGWELLWLCTGCFACRFAFCLAFTLFFVFTYSIFFSFGDPSTYDICIDTYCNQPKAKSFFCVDVVVVFLFLIFFLTSTVLCLWGTWTKSFGRAQINSF